jgi:hypothetical protein
MSTRDRLASALASLILAATCVTGQAAPAHPSLPALGTLDGLGVNIHFTDPKPGELEMLAATGVKWVRMDMTWVATERKKGEYDFSAYDRLVAALARAKLRALFVLDYGNPIYSDPGDTPPYTSRAGTPEFRAAYARWAVAAVSRYAGKGFLWEIWNEPNFSSFWKPRPSPADYSALVMETGKALRDAGLCKDNHSGEALIGPACSLVDLPFIESCFKAGALNYWCAVSMHPYRLATPETVVDDYRALRALIYSYSPGSSIPIISGEWGYSTAPSESHIDEPRQAALLARELLTNISHDIAISIWYDWRDDGGDPANAEHHFGLVRLPYVAKGSPPYQPKPAYNAIKTLAEQLGGFTFNKQVWLPAADPAANVVIDLFSRGPDTRIVAWLASGGDAKCSLPVSDCILQGTSCQGAPLPDQHITSPSSTVSLNEAPAYFAPKSPDSLLMAALAWEKAPLDILRDAPSPATSQLTFRNPLAQPLTIKGMSSPLQPGASVQIQSAPLAPARMPLDRFNETDGHLRPRRAYLNLLSPRCLLAQQFTSIVGNFVNLTLLPPGSGFELLRIENPSGAPWQGRARILSGNGQDLAALPYDLSIPAGATHQDVRLPLDHPPQTPGPQLQITAEGGTFTTPLPVPMPWGTEFKVVPRGNDKVMSTQSIAPATPPEGAPPSQTPCFEIKYHFDPGYKYIRVIAAKDPPPIQGKPDAVGLWLDGDGQTCRFRGLCRDSTGQVFQLPGAHLVWKGWQFLRMPMSGQIEHWNGANDGRIHYPIVWDSMVIDGIKGPVDGDVYFSAPTLEYQRPGASASSLPVQLDTLAA